MSIRLLPCIAVKSRWIVLSEAAVHCMKADKLFFFILIRGVFFIRIACEGFYPLLCAVFTLKCGNMAGLQGKYVCAKMYT